MTGVTVFVCGASTAARAQTSDSKRAEALFREAKMLRDGGRTLEACSKFAQSKELGPGIGVSLNLADCYERLGRTASAWYEFNNAEKLAREHEDPRADVAHSRGESLASKLNRVTIAVAEGTDANEIDLDEQPVPRAAYNVALAVDPGDHVLKVVPKAGPARTLDVHVTADSGPVTVRAADAKAPPRADATPKEAAALGPADALFEQGKRLRDAGEIEKACAAFAQSQAIGPGVGITMHLADCYERLGRTGSAWTEFVLAEKTAHERADQREATAHTRAAALEPKLQRLTIAVGAAAPEDTSLVQLDGRTVPKAMWHVAIVTDPGDHLVTFQAPTIERHTYPVHVDARASVTVRVGDAPAGPQSTEATPLPSPSTAAAPIPSPPPNDPPRPHPGSTRKWVEIGLLGGAVVAAGVGLGLLVVKNDSWSNGGANGGPYVDPVAAAGSKIALGTAGAAAAAAIVLYLTTPRSSETALRLSPAPMVGGAGALLQGAF
jgi:hypothetical protein